MKYYHVMQHDTTDCGAACFCMISRYYGYKITIAKARKLVNTDKFGTNIYGITSGAEKIGFESYGLEGDYKELIDGINNNDFKFPFIALTINKKMKAKKELINNICILFRLPNNNLVTVAVVDHNNIDIPAYKYCFFIIIFFLKYTLFHSDKFS